MSVSGKVPHTPCYLVDKGILEENLKTLSEVEQSSGCEILLALKAFAMFSTSSLIGKYLSGTNASSLDEARLGSEEFGGQVHVYAPAYKQEEFADILGYASHVNFNSFSQWEKFKKDALSSEGVKFGLRINPEHSEVKVPLYDPCAPASRLGIRAGEFAGRDLEGITGLHFHTLCELNADSLERTLKAVEKKFAPYLDRMEWVNFGGGHHITREDYEVELLVALIKDFRKRYGVSVYLEPGEAVALNAGVFICSVLDIIPGSPEVAILDASAAAHTPDVLEMPYRPGLAEEEEGRFRYRLGGLSCLAGDFFGEYSFSRPLEPGDRLTFTDMAHYTMVKNNTFNGVRLPSIAVYDPATGEVEIVRSFGYEDYRGRLS
ncbi:MAG: carboxynorspermidine decarboxylase [Candidatus Omnitrophica bacterium]|nr:carboxynorspermidine decarboxylase [Candidatus Omnitrophota bacterium]